MAEILKSVQLSDDIVYLNAPKVLLNVASENDIEERLELARQKGYEQGCQQKATEAERSMSERAETFDRLLASIPNAINDNRLALSAEIADIVWNITQQFFIQQQLSKDTVASKVMEALEQLNEAQHIELFLHPNDLAFLQREKTQLDLNLEKAVESTTSAYCTDSSRLFDDFSPHRMGDTASVKNHQKVLKNQHIRHSRYDSTAFSRLNPFFSTKIYHHKYNTRRHRGGYDAKSPA